ncbi:cytochrome c [Lysobacter sp. M15]|uniref:c-type cytochrome n=1 Tax=Lysobacter sp. M15 TaxID=2916837 RepID=UPI001F5AAD20|nr:cytochrome c [Lysobacter sp. M15]
MPTSPQNLRCLLLVGLFATALGACGKSEPQASSPPDTTARESAAAPATAPAPPATDQGLTPGEQAAARGIAPDTAIPAPTGPAKPIPQIEPIEATPQLVEEGKKLYFTAGCNACHGGTGGGGMCPSLINDIWVYGSDDSTLHTLVKEGSQAMQTTYGHARVGKENVVGLMMPFGQVLTDEEINKILAYVHSINPTAGKVKPPAADAAGAR